MDFIADKQTLQDLNVLGKYNAASLFSLFNQTVTRGGEQLMEEMFKRPLTDHDAINARTGIFRYFTDKEFCLPFDATDFALAEQYLLSGDEGTSYLFNLLHAGRRGILRRMGVMQEYELVQHGMQALIKVLQQMTPFLQQLLRDRHQPYYTILQTLLIDAVVQNMSEKLQHLKAPPDNLFQFASLDYLFRCSGYQQLRALFNVIYEIDLAIAVGKVARDRGFSYPHALPRDSAMLELRNCRHPALAAAIGNDCYFDSRKNVLFLTGANMAGKSTFMKSLGSAFYLAHMGFPVAADSMTFSVKAGIFSSINVSDNLNQGISHFYAEVLRVKEVATSVCGNNDLLVIFDELFKGTNVKDAFDATLEVTKAFSLFRCCSFVISTHIIEVGTKLKEDSTNITYSYMPTVLKNNVPTYPYKMEQGITSDRQGMMIIENEGILEMIGA